VTRSGVTSAAQTIDWGVDTLNNSTLSANEFVGGVFPSGTLSFAAGETTMQVAVELVGDLIDEDDFYEAISTFKGASKRLEKIAESNLSVAFKDFAHSPSKVEATTNAVKEQYQDRLVVACLELHTYSSLNAEFLKEYKGALDAADVAVVFYSPHAVKIKKLKKVTHEQIANAFERDDLIIYTNPDDFKQFLFSQDFGDKALLLMSSGNYGGLDFDELKALMN